MLADGEDKVLLFLSPIVGTDVLQGFKSLFDVPSYLDLRGEDVPHNALLVYDVGHPTREQSEAILRTP